VKLFVGKPCFVMSIKKTVKPQNRKPVSCRIQPYPTVAGQQHSAQRHDADSFPQKSQIHLSCSRYQRTDKGPKSTFSSTHCLPPDLQYSTAGSPGPSESRLPEILFLSWFRSETPASVQVPRQSDQYESGKTKDTETLSARIPLSDYTKANG